MKSEERRAHPRKEIATPAEITVDGASEGAEQREHARLNVTFEINIEAGLRLGGMEIMRLTLVGKTIDISRGGMLIEVDQDVIPGASCEVCFPDANGQIAPDRTVGKVRRSRATRDAFQLAVQFDEPLMVLEGES